MGGIERNSQMNAQAQPASSGERDSLASASGTASAKPKAAPSAVSTSVRHRPASTGSAKIHWANTPHSQRGLPSTELRTTAISAIASTVPAVRARWRAGTTT